MTKTNSNLSMVESFRYMQLIYFKYKRVFKIYIHSPFQGIHLLVPLTTSSVKFFPSSLGISYLSTSYTFTMGTQLVLISLQLLVRPLTVAKITKKKANKHEALYEVDIAENPIKCISGQSLSHKKAWTKHMVFRPIENSAYLFSIQMSIQNIHSLSLIIRFHIL